MSAIALDRFRQTLLDLFSEACEGPQDPPWFVSHDRPDPSLFGTLAALSAAQASTPAVEGGRTIAAHSEHLRWSLALANTYYRGEMPSSPWSESWAVQMVDEEQWQRVQDGLRREYDTLHEAIARHEDFSDDVFLHGTMAIVPHAAYHLGAIRQLAAVARASTAGG